MGRKKVFHKCDVVGCERETKGYRRYCTTHHSRIQKYGNPDVLNSRNPFRNPLCKLLPEDVLQIKEVLKRPYHGICVDLANVFGVTRETIRHIRDGKTWKVDVAADMENQMATGQRAVGDFSLEVTGCIYKGCGDAIVEDMLCERHLARRDIESGERVCFARGHGDCSDNDRLIYADGYGFLCETHHHKFDYYGDPRLGFFTRDADGLSLYDIRDIKDAVLNPYYGQGKMLSERYGVAEQKISAIKHGKIYSFDVDKEIRLRESLGLLSNNCGGKDKDKEGGEKG